MAVSFTLLTIAVHSSYRPLVRLDWSIARYLHHQVQPRRGLVDVLRGRANRRVRLAVTMATGGLLGVDLKALLARTRPNLSPPIVTVSGYSFPSNHALNSMLFFTCLIVVVYPLVHRATRVALIAGSALVVLAIGLDRMALGVHYASDVLGGWLIALATVATTAAGFNPWRLQRTISASQDKSSRPGTP